MEITVGLLCIWSLFMILMLYRNKWVKDEKLKLVHKIANNIRKEFDICKEKEFSGEKAVKWPDVEEYFETHFDEKYFSYNEMLYTFWIWDVEKMRYY